MAKVFLVEHPKNVEPTAAEEFGPLHYAFEQNQRRPSVFQNQAFGKAAVEAMVAQGYRPEEDFFCLTGGLLPVSNVLVALLNEFGEIKVLCYASNDLKYVPRKYSIEEDEEAVCSKK